MKDAIWIAFLLAIFASGGPFIIIAGLVAVVVLWAVFWTR